MFIPPILTKLIYQHSMLNTIVLNKVINVDIVGGIIEI